MLRISDIYEGWKNHIFPSEKLKDEIERVASERLRICDTCYHNSKFHKTLRLDRHCTICGCTLTAKTKCLSCNCPLNIPKWKSVLTEEQEEKIGNDE